MYLSLSLYIYMDVIRLYYTYVTGILPQPSPVYTPTLYIHSVAAFAILFVNICHAYYI